MHRPSILAALIALATDAAWACPNCKFAIETTSAQSQAAAYSYSILFMLAAILSLFGVIAGGLVWLNHREEQALIHLAASSPSVDGRP